MLDCYLRFSVSAGWWSVALFERGRLARLEAGRTELPESQLCLSALLALLEVLPDCGEFDGVRVHVPLFALLATLERRQPPAPSELALIEQIHSHALFESLVFQPFFPQRPHGVLRRFAALIDGLSAQPLGWVGSYTLASG